MGQNVLQAPPRRPSDHRRDPAGKLESPVRPVDTQPDPNKAVAPCGSPEIAAHIGYGVGRRYGS
jgi:hypothetical protein